MAYTRPGESGFYIFGGENYVDFTGTIVSDDEVDVFIYKLYNYSKNGDNEFWGRYHRGSRIIDNYLLNKTDIKKHHKHSTDLKSKAAEISALADEIWHEHYTRIIGAEQVEYMLAKFQSPEQIYADITENDYVYFTAHCQKRQNIIGYCAVQPRENHLFLSKIYVRRDYRSKGIARSFLNEIYALCRFEYKFDKIYLTVNKNNHGAIAMYKKMGFENVEEVKVDIGGGFFMDDYVMEKFMIFPEDNSEEYDKRD
jgi:ribosomal protein S18 acetylase RimI-like enzyme